MEQKVLEIKGTKGFLIIMDDNPIIHEETSPDSHVWKCGCREGWGPSAQYYKSLCNQHSDLPAINRYDDFFSSDGFAITATRLGGEFLLKKLIRALPVEKILKIAKD